MNRIFFSCWISKSVKEYVQQGWTFSILGLSLLNIHNRNYLLQTVNKTEMEETWTTLKKRSQNKADVFSAEPQCFAMNEFQAIFHGERELCLQWYFLI